MGKVLRATGVVLIAVGFGVVWHAYHTLYKKNTTTVLLKTLGNGLGSKYSVCSKGDADISRFTSVDFEEKHASTLKYYMYNIENPTEYLNGDDAIAVEKGPYSIKKHTIKYNVGFKESKLSTNTVGAIEYDVANAYVVLDKNVDVTSTLQRDSDDLSLSWSSEDRQSVTSYDKELPSHLSMSDTITNISPIYLSALGQFNDEFSLVLSTVCSAEQIANIEFAGTKAQCSSAELGDATKTDCACCMLNDAYLASPNQIDFVNCHSLVDEHDVLMGTFSLLSYWDGGIPVKEPGSMNYNGALFNETFYGQSSFYSPLIQKHTANDLLFGYPSAFIGKMVPNMYMSEAQKVMIDNGIASPTKTEIATEILTGAMDDHIPFPLGDLATYTKHVGSVCLSTCATAAETKFPFVTPIDAVCEGHAPARHTTNDMNKIVLGEIDCKPYSSTFSTIQMCTDAAFQLSQDPTAAGMKACTCADGSDDWQTTGCCLASGEWMSVDLTATGCLYPVAGILDSNYVGMDAVSATGKPKVDVGQAIQAWVSKEPSKKTSQFVCPNPGFMTAEHKVFGNYETLSGQDSLASFYSTGNPRIRQDDIDSGSTPYSVPVGGLSTKLFPAIGLKAWFHAKGVSDGHYSRAPVPVVVENLKAPIQFVEDWTTTAKVCGTDLCLQLARLYPSSDTFMASDSNAAAGTGLPYNGLQPVGHFDGPTTRGRPAYMSQPLFYNGDAELFSQQKNTHVGSADGNGIKIYRPKVSTDPGAFTTTNTNYELIDQTWVDANHADLRSYLDLEPATGLGVRSKVRLAKSHSIWECDPSSNDKCKLSGFSDGSKKCYAADGYTYACSAANLLTPNVVGGKITPTYWYEDARTEVDTNDVNDINVIAMDWYNLAVKFTWVFTFSFYLIFFCGYPMLFSVFTIFGEDHSFLETGPIGGDKKGTGKTDGASTTSSVAASSSVEAN